MRSSGRVQCLAWALVQLFAVATVWSLHASSRIQRHASTVTLAGSAAKENVVVPDAVATLLVKAGIDSTDATLEPVTDKAAFCNTVYRVRYNESGRSAIAKVFSPLALKRMDATRPLGQLDRLAAAAGIAPNILATTETALLMEDCEGSVITDAMVHGIRGGDDDNTDDNDVSVCTNKVAAALGHLHQLPGVEPSATNMLWRACTVMLSLTDESCLDTTAQGWTLQRLHETVDRHREQLQRLQLPLTASGHGDCKPSNVLAEFNGSIKFIDLELAGTHYRAFDLAKFWRTACATDQTEARRRAFYETYAATAITDHSKTTVQTLELEADLLLPLAWLEAAIFFGCMATQDAAQAHHWNGLAADRLEQYTDCMQGKRLDQQYL